MLAKISYEWPIHIYCSEHFNPFESHGKNQTRGDH